MEAHNKSKEAEAVTSPRDDHIASTVNRKNWDNSIEFVLSCWTYAVGLGNVWRFPYLCYRYGGGVFLIAYIIMMIVMGMPIFLLELLMGQYTGIGPDQAFRRIAPIFGGIGYACLVVITLISIYYMVIIAWTVFYFFASFTSELRFGSCHNDFNTIGCFSAFEDAKCDENSTFFNLTCTPMQQLCTDNNHIGFINRTFCLGEDGEPIHISAVVDRILATEEYFNEYMLGRGDASWEDFGHLRWQLVLCLLFSWVVGYFCVIKGVQTAGKAVYFTTIFPYIILTALVIQGALLDGAVDGILLFITPEWEKFADAEVWGMAASQTFYSFGISCGSLVTLASYNKFHNNCIRDALIVTVANGFTALYAGFAIFSMIGFLAKQMDLPVESVATDGPGLAFVAYPEAILRLPAPTFWAIIFFFMLFILGIGSQFAGIQAISTLVLDKRPEWRKRQWLVTLVICIGLFAFGIPMCFQGGVYLLTLMEWNTASWAIMLIGFSEVVSVAWFYGINRFLENMKSMSMKLSCVPYWFWWLCWTIITPAALLGVFIFQMVTFSLASYEDYNFPVWADWLGVIIGISTLVPLPVMAIYTIFKRKYTGRALFRPTPLWGPQTAKTDSMVDLAKSEETQDYPVSTHF
ncbi:hypothetical protein Trydic_g21568 [Trypoxylus dichotomus]